MSKSITELHYLNVDAGLQSSRKATRANFVSPFQVGMKNSQSNVEYITKVLLNGLMQKFTVFLSVEK